MSRSTPGKKKTGIKKTNVWWTAEGCIISYLGMQSNDAVDKGLRRGFARKKWGKERVPQTVFLRVKA